MKTLAIFISALFFGFATLANDNEVKLSTEVQQIDGLHARISYQNATSPVQITVFNQQDGVVMSKRTEAHNFSTELNYLDLQSGDYTVVIESTDTVITQNLTVAKEDIEVEVTLFSQTEGVVYKSFTTVKDLEEKMDALALENGEYSLLIERNGKVIENRKLNVK